MSGPKIQPHDDIFPREDDGLPNFWMGQNEEYYENLDPTIKSEVYETAQRMFDIYFSSYSIPINDVMWIESAHSTDDGPWLLDDTIPLPVDIYTKNVVHKPATGYRKIALDVERIIEQGGINEIIVDFYAPLRDIDIKKLYSLIGLEIVEIQIIETDASYGEGRVFQDIWIQSSDDSSTIRENLIAFREMQLGSELENIIIVVTYGSQGG